MASTAKVWRVGQDWCPAPDGTEGTVTAGEGWPTLGPVGRGVTGGGAVVDDRVTVVEGLGAAKSCSGPGQGRTVRAVWKGDWSMAGVGWDGPTATVDSVWP